MRGALLAVCLVLAACGGGGDPTPEPQAQTVSAPDSVTQAPAQPIPEPVAQAPAATVQSPSACATLPHWFSGPVSGKSIAWVGDSTTWQLQTVPANLAYLSTTYQAEGKPLHGVVMQWFGKNGNTLPDFLSNQPPLLAIDAVVAAKPDLIVFSYGINDVRLGTTSEAQLVAKLRQAVNAMRARLPNTDIVLRMPNIFLTTDVGGFGFVSPNSAAQAYTDILRNAYRTIAKDWPNVVLYDSQALLFGEVALVESPLMANQIHPSEQGYARVIDQIAGIVTPPAECH